MFETFNSAHKERCTQVFLQQNAGRIVPKEKQNLITRPIRASNLIELWKRHGALYPQDTALHSANCLGLMWTKSRELFQANKGACWLQFIFAKSNAVCKRRPALLRTLCVVHPGVACRPEGPDKNVNFLNVKILFRIAFELLWIAGCRRFRGLERSRERNSWFVSNIKSLFFQNARSVITHYGENAPDRNALPSRRASERGFAKFFFLANSFWLNLPIERVQSEQAY